MSRPYATALTIAFVTALFGLVASTAHTSVWAPAREGGAPLTQLLGIVAGMACLGTAVVSVVWFARGRSGAEPSLGQAIRRAAPATIVGVALVSLVSIAQLDLERYRGPGAEVPGVDLSSGREGVRLRMDWGGPAVRRAGEAEAVDSTASERPSTAAVFLGILLLVGGVALVAVATTWWSTRRRVDRSPAGPVAALDPRRQAARGAILVTIDAMLEDPDPRTAIIGAYARLLEELSASGAARRDYEGPKEHLHRVLIVLDVPAEPLERLIGLFEEARFSTHPLTASHRDQALRALREVASDLTTPQETPAAASAS